MRSLQEYVERNTPSREQIDLFLDEQAHTWSRFDPEVGYVLGNYMPKDGIDNSSTISTSGNALFRTQHHYADKPCRINTFGNSFTQGQQVSDGETWQEYLAAHLGEPIRNFGVGGFGVYQAYRRLLRTAKDNAMTGYNLLFIWGDDHNRSILRSRFIVTAGTGNPEELPVFHGNFWANVEMNLSRGEMEENESLCPTPESLYRMTDSDFVYQAVGGDLMAQIYLFLNNDINTIDLDKMCDLAEILGVAVDRNGTDASLRESLAGLRDEYGFAATRYVLRKTKALVESNGRRLMIVLMCPRALSQLVETGARYDQPIVDFLSLEGYNSFDVNVAHVEDLRSFNLSLELYKKRYLTGHYNPAGNHFLAFSIKNKVVDWLEPKPATYGGPEGVAAYV